MDSSTTLPDQKPYTQAQSAFFRLPYEIREVIYRLAIGHQEIHITQDNEEFKLKTYFCMPDSNKITAPLLHGTDCLRLPHLVTGEERTAESDEVQQSKNSPSLLALLLTCRYIYSEAIDILYNSNTFIFTDVWGPERLRKAVQPQQWTQIQSVYLSLNVRYYTGTLPGRGVVGTAFAAMTGLRTLRIELRWNSWPEREDMLAFLDFDQVVRPFNGVKQCKVFELCVTRLDQSQLDGWKLQSYRAWLELLKEKPWTLFIRNYEQKCWELFDINLAWQKGCWP